MDGCPQALIVHPDKHPDSDEATRKTAEVSPLHWLAWLLAEWTRARLVGCCLRACLRALRTHTQRAQLCALSLPVPT